jgi:UDPglucose 6-dehydrogenase
LTEWNQFRALDLERARTLMRGRIFVDLRNVYDVDTMTEAGFTYVGVGKGVASRLPPLALAASA